MVFSVPGWQSWFSRLWKSRRVKVTAAATLGVALLTGGLSLEPWVRAKARSSALERGVLLAVEDVGFGWRRVSLYGVSVRLKDVDALSATLDRVDVALSWGLSPQRITFTGGKVELDGTPDKLKKQIEHWRSQRRASQGDSEGSGLEIVARDLDATWQRSVADTQIVQRVKGFGYARDALGNEGLLVRALSASYDGLRVDVAGATLRLERDGKKRVLSALSADKVDAEWALAGRANSDPPVKKSNKNSVFPTLESGRNELVRRAVRALADFAESALPPNSKIDLGQLNLALKSDESKLHLGPNRVKILREKAAVKLDLLPASEDQATPLTLGLRLPFEAGEVALEIRGGPVSLASLGVRDGDFGLREVEHARFAAGGKLALSKDGEVLGFDGEGELGPLTLKDEALSPNLLVGMQLGIAARGELQLDGSSYRIDDARVSIGDVEVSLSGQLEKVGEDTRAQFRGGIALASCQALLASAPEGLLPLLDELKLSGTFALDAAIEFDSAHLSSMKVKWDFQNDCRVQQVSEALAPRRFLRPFRLTVKDSTGRIVSIETGPGTPGWTPLAAISPHMETAVLVCEDGRFFRHRGFDREAIENSIKENLKAGRFVRGASTISMQLAKNLYLSFDKTLSRKLQEAVLTTLLEQELSKQEMMELYLNVIEYGPGIYGIEAAAKHYFDTIPAQLSLGQSLYLASILPNPAQFHFEDGGAMSKGWRNYLSKLMRIALKIGRISEPEYEMALQEDVRFGVAGTLGDTASLTDSISEHGDDARTIRPASGKAQPFATSPGP